MKTASLIQFNRIIFQLTFTVAPAARPLVSHCVSPQCIWLPWLYLLWSGWCKGRVMRATAWWQRWANTLLIFYVLSWLGWWWAAVLGSQSAVHTAACTQSHSTSHAHRSLANPVTSGLVGWVEAFRSNSPPTTHLCAPQHFASTHSLTPLTHFRFLLLLCSFHKVMGGRQQHTSSEKGQLMNPCELQPC